ncbi:MAG: hypothetical protein HZA25_03585 [Candidatus Niyogibacteria bacterium]|nr:hypothetical protein [Candidatus Niyogibacteria bacterium]
MDIARLRELAQDNSISDKEFVANCVRFMDELDPENCSMEQIEEFYDVVEKYRPEIAKRITVLMDAFSVILELVKLSKKK